MLTRDIPESVTTHFLVATAEQVEVEAADLCGLLGENGWWGSHTAALAATARELLSSPLLLLRGEPAAWSGLAPVLDGIAGPDAELTRLRQAGHHLVLTSVAPPAAQPLYAQASRYAARVLAERTGGVVADLRSGHVLPGGDLPGLERERFVLADDWVLVFMSADERGVRAETAGLARFGLPDLAARRVPLGRMLTAANVLRALSYRLLAEHWRWLSDHPGGRTRQIAAGQYAGAQDLWRFWGARPVSDGGVGVRLAPEGNLLVVGPPDDRPEETWWDDRDLEVIPPVTEVATEP